MMKMLGMASMVASAMAVPMAAVPAAQQLQYTVSADVMSADIVGLNEALAAHAANVHGHATEVSIETARRQMQASGNTNLRIAYTVRCGASCDAVNDAVTALATDPAAGAAHAAALISAINTAATAAGFSSAVVTSSAADIASTMQAPTQVTITLPGGGDTPAPGLGTEMLTNGALDGPIGWTYIGCFRDNEGGRDLTGWAGSAGASVPVDAANGCAGICAGYDYFGLQWVNECFCDNAYNNGNGNNGNQGNCPGGECPMTDCDADGALDDDGTASLCANGQGNCGNRNAVYSISNTIPGWGTVAAAVSIVNQMGRVGVLSVADDGSFSSVTQTVTTVVGQQYFITMDVWADSLGNTAGNAYCTSTDSNGLLDIHAGTDQVARHGEMQVCPVEDQPATWQTVEAIYTATETMTTIALHSESALTAYFDSVSMIVADIPAWSYIGCYVDSAERDLNGQGPSAVPSVPLEAANACAEACAGFQYFGLQWVNECFCDNDYGGLGEEPAASCDVDGVITDGVADLCSNGQGNCGWANAVYQIGLAPAPPPVNPTVNLALAMPTSQSSNGWGSTDGGRAVDGTTDGSWGTSSCTHTQAGDPEWWQVDLGGMYSLNNFNLYHRTDCCQDRLVGANIMLSQTTDYTTGVACAASTSGGNVAQPETGDCGGAVGMFVTVQHSNDYITICEFEIFGAVATSPTDATNVALGQPATQSTEGWSGAAARAVDGTTSGQWGEASCTHTQNGTPEWWQVDLGATYAIWDFNLYHRTDCCQDRLIAANIVISRSANYGFGVTCAASTDGGNTAQP